MDHEENGGISTVYLLGCPFGLVMLLVVLLLSVVVGGAVLSSVFPAATETNAQEIIVTDAADVDNPLDDGAQATETADDAEAEADAETSEQGSAEEEPVATEEATADPETSS